MTVGETVQLQTLGIFSDGSTETVTATSWTATPNGVGTVDNSGRLTGVRLGVVTVTAAYNNLLGALVLRVIDEPAQIPSTNLAGTWTGRVLVTECTRASGTGPSPCRTNIQLPFELTLTHPSPYSLSGTFVLGEANGPVDGWRDLVGRMYLKGVLRFTGDFGPVSYELTEWNVRAVAPLNEMEGDFEALERFSNFFDAQVLRTKHVLIDVRR